MDFQDIHDWFQRISDVSQCQPLYLYTDNDDNTVRTLQLCFAKCREGTSVTNHIFIGNYRPYPYWISKPIEPICLIPANMKLLHEKLFINFIEYILGFYSSRDDFTIDLNNLNPVSFKHIFNLCFFMVCIISLVKIFLKYPQEGIPNSLFHHFHSQLSSPQLKEALKKLLQIIGYNLEVEWMRSICATYAYCNQSSNSFPPLNNIPCSLSCSFSTYGFWKVQLVCPIMAMKRDIFGRDKIPHSLDNFRLEGVVQLQYSVNVQEKLIKVDVNIENVRIDILPLIENEEFKTLTIEDKHFPSRVQLNLSPVGDTEVESVSVGQSSVNTKTQIGIGIQRTIQVSLELTKPSVGGKHAAQKSMSTNLNPWRFDESANGCRAIFDWVLYDVEEGKEVYLSELPKNSQISSKAWFKDRYSSANRPFLKQGGVIFAADMYKNPTKWRIRKNPEKNATKWKLEGQIWLTYLPNKLETSYYETRSIKFKEILDLSIP